MATIRAWQKAAHALAASKGFHDGDTPQNEGERLPKYLMNLHSELSELWEAWRAGKMRDPCDKADKMSGIGARPLSCLEEELADIAIRVFDTAEALGVDLEGAIEAKHAYNGTRAHKHGGKNC